MSTALQVMNGEPSTAVAQRAPSMLRPIAPAAEVLQAQELTRQLIHETLQEGRDYGTIPGVKKPSLLKPGAERVALAFGVTSKFRVVEKEIDHDRVIDYVKKEKVWRNEYKGDKRYDTHETPGKSIGLYRYVVECELVHRESGQVVGSGIGACSSLESKYIDRPRDVENTILKMASKRAFVGATLTTFGLSEQFTQDVEDMARDEPAPATEDVERLRQHLESEQRGNPAPASGPSGPTPLGGAEGEPSCPTCGGKMWDNREAKRNPKAPDFKCRSRSCDGVVWPGQWPPKPAASDTQRKQIEALLVTADVSDKQAEKIRGELADTAKVMDAARADDLITRLTKLNEKVAVQAPLEGIAPAAESARADAAVAAAGAAVRQTDSRDGLPF